MEDLSEMKMLQEQQDFSTASRNPENIGIEKCSDSFVFQDNIGLYIFYLLIPTHNLPAKKRW